MKKIEIPIRLSLDEIGFILFALEHFVKREELTELGKALFDRVIEKLRGAE